MKYVSNFVKSFWTEEDAPTMAEYGLLLALIAVVVIVGAAFLGVEINTLFGEVGTVISTAN